MLNPQHLSHLLSWVILSAGYEGSLSIEGGVQLMILALQGVDLIKKAGISTVATLNCTSFAFNLKINLQCIEYLFIELGLNVGGLHLQLLQRFDPAPHRRRQGRNVTTGLTD